MNVFVLYCTHLDIGAYGVFDGLNVDRGRRHHHLGVAREISSLVERLNLDDGSNRNSFGAGIVCVDEPKCLYRH